MKEVAFSYLLACICVLPVAVAAHAQLRVSPVACEGSQPALSARGNNIRVQITSDGNILTSSDRNAWTEQRPIRTFFRAVTYGAGLFVAVGGSYADASGIIMTSHDGTNWIRRNAQNKTIFHGVAYGSDVFVAVGDAGKIFTSQNGICWKERSSGTAALLAAVAFGNGLFVAGGESGTIATSTNGIHWMCQSLTPPVYVGRILFHDGQFVTPNHELTFTSSNGHKRVHCDPRK